MEHTFVTAASRSVGSSQEFVIRNSRTGGRLPVRQSRSWSGVRDGVHSRSRYPEGGEIPLDAVYPLVSPRIAVSTTLVCRVGDHTGACSRGLELLSGKDRRLIEIVPPPNLKRRLEE
jgi:hypothetical protein